MILKRLLGEANLTYKGACELSISIEMATKDAGEIQMAEASKTVVNKLSNTNPRRPAKFKCYRCGEEGHKAPECK